MSKPAQLTPFGSALAGGLGACFSNAVVYPLDTVKTRIQASTTDSGDKLSVLAVLERILREEGLFGYYRGFMATMINTFSMQYAYFFFYSFVRTSYMKRLASKRPAGSTAPPLSTAAELALGAVAGALAQVFTIPVSVIATRQQVGRSLDRPKKGKGKAMATDLEANNGSDEKEEYDDSFLGVAREIIAEEGVTGLWLGLRPGLVLTVNPAITYGMFERVKSLLLLAKGETNMNAKLNPWMAFAVGAISKALATVVTYPYIMAKVRIQARSADIEDAEEDHRPAPKHSKPHHKNGHHVGALTVLARVWRRKGFIGWYQGMGAQLVKAVLTQALLFMSKDQFEHFTLALIALFYRLQSVKP